ncbi:YfcL family protein [Salinimonas sp. HHU 13199]|uniref:YfcL family protein n=1 Tax=Salinimonas profundi TaxID=2729140 RepID=A0ABR8LCW3_9ALTE|nr:YfcL family protein [Salinimonas profundi]MBD3584146.1 YfcL family protein [Salinimonas profundi]
MQPSPLAEPAFIDAVMHIENQLDNVVDHGSDDELFIASYLQGHFAVISRPLEMEQNATVALLDETVKESLQQAFNNNELEPDDQKKVTALWQQLIASAQQ